MSRKTLRAASVAFAIMDVLPYLASARASAVMALAGCTVSSTQRAQQDNQERPLLPFLPYLTGTVEAWDHAVLLQNIDDLLVEHDVVPRPITSVTAHLV